MKAGEISPSLWTKTPLVGRVSSNVKLGAESLLNQTLCFAASIAKKSSRRQNVNAALNAHVEIRIDADR